MIRLPLLPLLPLLFLLSPGFGKASAQETRPNNMVTVSEGEDALLPCALSSVKNIDKFDWRKDNGEEEKKEVFMYNKGSYYGQGLQGQSEQFAGRVEFFKDELRSGNASIKILDTRLKDNGTYTCFVMNPVTSVVNIILNVVGVLKIRENVTGAARVPYVKTVHDKITWYQLECKAQGVPEPEVEWRNSAGKVLVNHVPQNQNGRSYVGLQLNVTRSDNYTCVVTQRSIYHQINNTMEVRIPDLVVVSEGDDAVLPCSLDSKENIENMEFSWSKEHEQVFLYDKGRTQDDGPLRGRITHFQHELKSGNASIKIEKTQMSDSGRYICHYSHIQKSYIILTVVGKKDKPQDYIWTVAVTFIILFLFATAALVGALCYIFLQRKPSAADPLPEQKKESMDSTSLSEPLNAQS